MKRLPVLLLALLATTSLFAGCIAVNTSRSPAPAASSQPQLEIWDRLYFGQDIPSGGAVSEADWATFLTEVVTPRFPNGLTVVRGEGQWRGESGAIAREKSFILEINHADTDLANRSVVEIAEEYKRRFKQEAVLRLREHVDAILY